MEIDASQILLAKLLSQITYNYLYKNMVEANNQFKEPLSIFYRVQEKVEHLIDEQILIKSRY